MRALVVDDDKTFCQQVGRAVFAQDEVIFAYDCKSAREFVKKESLDLLVTDYFLPDGNGLDLAKELKSTFSNLKTIIISGSTTKEIAIACVNAHVQGLIEKPFDAKELKALIFGITESSTISIQICDKDLKIKIGLKEIHLTATEFKIFHLLYKNQQRRLSRKEISRHIWSDLEVSENTFDTHLGNLKKKMGSYAIALTNIKGVGYNLNCETFSATSICT